MNRLLDALLRAIVYCLHPQLIVLSLLPLVLLVGGGWALMYFFWEPAQLWMAAKFQEQAYFLRLVEWLESLGFGRIRAVLGPAIVLFLAIPVLVILVLLLVAAFMAPVVVRLVARRRFPHLERKQGTSLLVSVVWSIGQSLLALAALILTLPLWLIPPLALIIPPLIWGWLTYRVMAFDVLADHASTEERRLLMREYRYPLLAIGVVTGYLGTAPGLIWASGALWIAMAPVVLPVALWLYTLTFVFSGLWFAHYGLSLLEDHRRPLQGGSGNETVVDVDSRVVETKDLLP